MSRIPRWFSIVLLAFSCAVPAAWSAPQKIWTYHSQSDAALRSLHLIAERSLAIAIAETMPPEVAVIDLESGNGLEAIVPLAPDSTEKLNVVALAASSRHIAVLAYDNAAGDHGRFFVLIYDAADRSLSHQFALPDDYPDHLPNISDPNNLIIDGDHLLVSTTLRDRIDDSDPVMLQYDLAAGTFVRGIGLLEFEPTAEKGWFGGRPATPDLFFANARVDGGMLFTAPLPEEPGSVTMLAFDLNKGETAPALPAVETTDRFVTLAAIEEDALFYKLSPPLATDANVVGVGSAVRIARETGEVLVTYSDPFAPDAGEMSMNAFIASHAEKGVKPYVGSSFPGMLSVSGGRVVGSAPNAPLNDVRSAGALAVFNADTGEPTALILPEEPGEDFQFGLEFAHEGDLLLVSTRNGFGYEGPRELVLYRLD